jgi:hypothetical protein
VSTPNTDLVGRRVTVTLGPDPRDVHTGRLMSLRGQHARIEDDNGVITAHAPVLDVQVAGRCDAAYLGELWSSQPCERAPGHDAETFHCDLYGRTW